MKYRTSELVSGNAFEIINGLNEFSNNYGIDLDKIYVEFYEDYASLSGSSLMTEADLIQEQEERKRRESWERQHYESLKKKFGDK